MRIIGLVGRAGCGKDTVKQMLMEIIGAAPLSFADPMKELAREVFEFSYEQLYGPSDARNHPDPRYGAMGTRWYNRVGRWLRRKRIQRNWARATDRFLDYHQKWLNELVPNWEKQFPYAASKLTDWFFDLQRHDVISPRLVLQTLGTEWGRSVHENLWVLVAGERAEKKLTMSNVVISDVRFINEARILRNEYGAEIWKIERPSVKKLGAGVKNHPSERDIDTPEMAALVTRIIHNNLSLDALRIRVCTAALTTKDT